MKFRWPVPARSASLRTEMANPFQGEVQLWLDGQPHQARLTLGALVELETELGAESMVALVERFESGRFSSRDVAAVLLAGLRACGWTGDMARLMGSDLRGGPVAAAQAAALLLARAFRIEGT